jgi:hypothetical protein
VVENKRVIANFARFGGAFITNSVQRSVLAKPEYKYSYNTVYEAYSVRSELS